MAIDMTSLTIGTTIFNTSTPTPEPLPYFIYDDNGFIQDVEERPPTEVVDNYALGVLNNALTQAMPNTTTFSSNSITQIGRNSFATNAKLAIVKLPNVTGIGAYAFQNCPSLTTIELQKLTMDYVKSNAAVWYIDLTKCTVVCKDGTLKPETQTVNPNDLIIHSDESMNLNFDPIENLLD